MAKHVETKTIAGGTDHPEGRITLTVNTDGWEITDYERYIANTLNCVMQYGPSSSWRNKKGRYVKKDKDGNETPLKRSGMFKITDHVPGESLDGLYDKDYVKGKKGITKADLQRIQDMVGFYKMQEGKDPDEAAMQKIYEIVGVEM